MIVISSCLVGVKCRYDGTSQMVEELKRLVDEGKAVAVCPEVLGGLPTPRKPCEIKVCDGERRVVDIDGIDRTVNFMKGAEEVLKICKQHDVDIAILKARSPSCGCGEIYDGTFTGAMVVGNGLTVELLLKNGIKVCRENDYRKMV